MAIAHSSKSTLPADSGLPAARLALVPDSEAPATPTPRRTRRPIAQTAKQSLVSVRRVLRVEFSAEKMALKAARGTFTDSRPPGLLTWSLGRDIALDFGKRGDSAARVTAPSTARQQDSEAC
jgi:hypothetical protein